MWGLLAILVLAADSPEFQAVALDGQTTAGRIVELSAQQIVLETDAGRVTRPLEELTRVSQSSAPRASKRPRTLSVELVDRSMLAASGYTVEGDTAHVEIDEGRTLDVPTRVIRCVRF